MKKSFTEVRAELAMSYLDKIHPGNLDTLNPIQLAKRAFEFADTFLAEAGADPDTV